MRQVIGRFHHMNPCCPAVFEGLIGIALGRKPLKPDTMITEIGRISQLSQEATTKGILDDVVDSKENVNQNGSVYSAARSVFKRKENTCQQA